MPPPGPPRCQNDNQCENNFYCDGGTCRPKRRTGDRCMNNNECLLGLCVEVLGLKVCVAP
jgi:hypothetical protein